MTDYCSEPDCVGVVDRFQQPRPQGLCKTHWLHLDADTVRALRRGDPLTARQTARVVEMLREKDEAIKEKWDEIHRLWSKRVELLDKYDELVESARRVTTQGGRYEASDGDEWRCWYGDVYSLAALLPEEQEAR